MNKLIITILVYSFSFLQKIFSYKFLKKIEDIYCKIRSLWLMSLFNECPYTVRFYRIGGLRGTRFISIGTKTIFQKGFFLTAYKTNLKDPYLKIGAYCNFGAYNHITCANSIKIGNNVLTGKWVTITDNSHGITDKSTMLLPPNNRPIISKGEVVIGNNVWIGEKVTILPAVKIGDGAIIAANSVVTKDVPPFSVAAGIPARVISKR